MNAVAIKWRVLCRDRKGRALPVMVSDSATAHEAINAGVKKAERFLPGRGWRAVAVNRAL